ncbi:MAG: hypothetical protein LKG23_06590 [Nitrospira sp.]|nr:hypothetical protein [Nitrospira sp.]
MKDCTPTGDCHFNKFRRPLYFHGMLLDDKDFRDEQEYHSKKRRLLNRMLHGSGVVCGLLFAKSDENTITMSCGLALDCAGQEIYVPSDVTFPVPVPDKEPKNPCAPKQGGKKICYRIRIAYTEEDTDFEQIHLPGGGCDDKTCKPTRKREGFCIKFDECECPETRKPAECKDLTVGFHQPVTCGCGCDCTCGADHWVSIGTMHVADGKIVGDPTYDCRDYVFSGQMLKQLFTQVPPPTDDCACPDQFERFKELLSLICKTAERTTTTEHRLVEDQGRLNSINTSVQKLTLSMEGRLKDLYNKYDELKPHVAMSSALPATTPEPSTEETSGKPKRGKKTNPEDSGG